MNKTGSPGTKAQPQVELFGSLEQAVVVHTKRKAGKGKLSPVRLDYALCPHH
jgi:hypothetical protein